MAQPRSMTFRSQIRTNPLLSVRCRDLPMTETADDVVIYHPDGLHVGIDDGGTDETKSLAL